MTNEQATSIAGLVRSHVGDGMPRHQAIRHVAVGLGLSEALVKYALAAATGSVAERPEEPGFGHD